METGVDVSDRGGQRVDIDLCGYPLPALVVPPDSEAGQSGADVFFLLCSARCASALRRAAELHTALTGRAPAGAPARMLGGLRLVASKVCSAMRPLADAAACEAWLHGCCAWCLEDLPETGEVMGLQLSSHKERPITGYEGGRIAVQLGGRPVVGFLPEAGTPAARRGQISFLFCSQRCSDELRAVLKREIWALSVH